MYESDMEDDTQVCRLKVCSKLNKRAPVFIADFQRSSVKTDEKNILKFDCCKSAADKDEIGYNACRTLLACSDHTNFTGSTPNEASHFRNFIGVRNKRTGKMKLYDSVLFRMKPIIASSKTDVASQMPTPKSYWEGMNELTENFGNKNRIRAMNARLRYAATDSSIEEKLNLEDLIIDSPSKKSIIFYPSQNLGYLPTKNPDALTADEVFDINAIITPEEYCALHEEAQSLIDATAEETSNIQSQFGKYVTMHLNENIDLQKAKYLIYFHYLVLFQHLKYADIQRKDPAPSIPQPFKQRMLETFTSVSKSANGRTSRAFPMQLKDKLVAYILVLALFIDNFIVNANLVTSELNLVGLPKFATIAHALGCHVKSLKIDNETIKFAELKLPLFVLQPKYAKK